MVEHASQLGKAAQSWSISLEPAKPTDTLLPILLSTPNTPETPETPPENPDRQQFAIQVTQVQKSYLDPLFTNTQQISWISGPSSKKR